MLLIFGPAEIFFANEAEFQFIYTEFAGYLALGAILLAVLVSLLIMLLPNKLYQISLAMILAASLAGYVQVMFLNKNLDLLGVNPEGYKIVPTQVFASLVCWFAIMIAVVIFSFWKKNIWKKCFFGVSGFLICIQIVALVSLWMTSKETAWKYEEGTWNLSGEEQYTVSSKENVIVFILDYFSNQYMEPFLAEYPNATDFLHDFNYYDNVDCTYYGTFPSMAHLTTGCEVDASLSTNEWFETIWSNEKTVDFYKSLENNGYKVNFFTTPFFMCGQNAELMKGKVSNVVNSTQNLDINSRLLLKTMAKMSCYRMAPNILKSFFYVNIDGYADIVTVKGDMIYHNNYEFYQGLKQHGLIMDDKHNYYIIQHLMGTHLYTTDENGNYKEESSLAETAKGCMVILEDYFNRMKELGVYDTATIIVTSDHGDADDSQVIFYIKRPGERHEESPIHYAPVSHKEFFPTIADALGEDASKYGSTIYDIPEDSQRERTVWVRGFNEAYPTVKYFLGEKDGDANVYNGYTYVGNIENLLKQIEEGPSQIMQMKDSFF